MKKINYFGYKIDAPDWAMYIATERNGDAWFYTKKPLFSGDQKKWESASRVASKVKQNLTLPVSSKDSMRNVDDILIDDDTQETSVDKNVESVREMLLDRSNVGIKKYGTTTCKNQLTHKQWLQHALEEALDMAVYLQAAIAKIEEDGEQNAN